ncbi:MAG TPA: CocE/NonD family hydrolase [Phycisphaerae bacterium]|nr:CocE/NonD family hydrolase [Phycisphaerae bacterium]HRW54280.1 CocE/NonD family hydrolase [Phycisphaerae bacterium]
MADQTRGAPSGWPATAELSALQTRDTFRPMFSDTYRELSNLMRRAIIGRVRTLRRPRLRFGPRHRSTFALTCIALSAVFAQAACLNERSFPFRTERLIRVSDSGGDNGARPTARAWLVQTHARLRSLVPASGYEPLLTEDLTTPDGRAVDVFDYFDKDPAYLHTAIGNLSGLTATAQVTGDTEAIEIPAPAWPGFDDVWIDVQPGVSISGRLGLATKDGEPIDADCIVLLPGLLGDNIRVRTRDICMGLRDAGFHTLALEFRGHGQAEAKYPSVPYNFSVMETPDLMVVSEWLQAKPHVRRTGLIGFSWSANTALLAAWEDGRTPSDPMVSAELAKRQTPFDRNRRHFEAGVIAVSPTLEFEQILDRLETPHAFSENPCLSSLQGTVAHRIERKQHGPPSGSLRKLIAYEFAKSRLNYEGSVADGLTYLRLAPYKDLPYEPKLEWARVPVLIIHSANDPLAYAQEVAQCFADTHNPNVACVMLHGGGHDGFASYCRDYLYSLFINFFDAERGPKATPYQSGYRRRAKINVISCPNCAQHSRTR